LTPFSMLRNLTPQKVRLSGKNDHVTSHIGDCSAWQKSRSGFRIELGT
jgi:hypothetical protein